MSRQVERGPWSSSVTWQAGPKGLVGTVSWSAWTVKEKVGGETTPQQMEKPGKKAARKFEQKSRRADALMTPPQTSMPGGSPWREGQLNPEKEEVDMHKKGCQS